MTAEATRAEVCVLACAEAWRGDGAILASPMGVIPSLGARLARLTFAPGLLLTDGDAYLLDRDEAFQARYAAAAADPEAWQKFRAEYLDGDEAAYQKAVST